MSTALFGGGALAAVPLGALADAEGYRSLWLAAAAASRARRARDVPPASQAAPAARARLGDPPGHRTYAVCVAAPFRVGQELELTVDSLAAGGRGVARHDGVVVFVDRALPGDRVMARIQRVKRRHGEAIAYERLSGGPDRVDAPCPHFGTCGGCRWQDLRYERQLEHKQQQVLDALQRIAGLPDPPLEPIVPAVRQYALPQQARVRLDGHARTASPWASTARAAGRRSSRSRSACSPASAATPCARRSSRGPARRLSRPTTSARTPATCGTSSCARACARASCSASSSPAPGDVPGVEELEAILAERAPGVVGVLHAVNDGVAEVASGIPHAPALRPRLVRGGDQRPAPARVGGLLPADEHRDGRRALPGRDRAGRAHRRRDRLGHVLRHRLDRARARGLGAPRDRRRDRRRGDRARARERARERRRQRRSSCAPTPARRRAT